MNSQANAFINAKRTIIVESPAAFLLLCD